MIWAFFENITAWTAWNIWKIAVMFILRKLQIFPQNANFRRFGGEGGVIDKADPPWKLIFEKKCQICYVSFYISM